MTLPLSCKNPSRWTPWRTRSAASSTTNRRAHRRRGGHGIRITVEKLPITPTIPVGRPLGGVAADMSGIRSTRVECAPRTRAGLRTPIGMRTARILPSLSLVCLDLFWVEASVCALSLICHDCPHFRRHVQRLRLRRRGAEMVFAWHKASNPAGAIGRCSLQRKQTGLQQYHHQSEIAGQFTNGYENNEPGRLHVVLNYQEQQSRKQSDQQNQSKEDARVGSAKQLVQSFSRCGQGTVHARQINGEQNKIHKQQPVFEVGKKAWSWLSAKFVYRHRQRGSAQSRIHQEQQREQMRPTESNARGRVHDEPIVEHNDDRRENGDGCGRAVQPAGQLPRGPEDAR